MGCGISHSAPAVAPDRLGRGGPPPRLVLFSEHAAEIPNFEEALRQCGTMSQQFSFEHATSTDLVGMIAALVSQHGLFERVAFAQHGPKRPPPAEPSDGADVQGCFWELSQNCVMTDPCQLSLDPHPARDVLVALGRATVPGGGVDLLSCALLSTWACPRKAWPQLRGFTSIEEQTDCRFSASMHALQSDPLQSEEECSLSAGVSNRRALLRGVSLQPQRVLATSSPTEPNCDVPSSLPMLSPESRLTVRRAGGLRRHAQH